MLSGLPSRADLGRLKMRTGEWFHLLLAAKFSEKKNTASSFPIPLNSEKKMAELHSLRTEKFGKKGGR